MIHWCTCTSWYFLPWYKYCILNKLSGYLWYINIGINKHGKALSSISAHPLLAYIQDGRHNKHVRLLSPRARHEAIAFLFCCYIMYRIVSCIVSWQLYWDTYRIVEKCIVAGLVLGQLLLCFYSWKMTSVKIQYCRVGALKNPNNR